MHALVCICSNVLQFHTAESIIQLSFLAQLFFGRPCFVGHNHWPAFPYCQHPCITRRPLLRGWHSVGRASPVTVRLWEVSEGGLQSRRFLGHYPIGSKVGSKVPDPKPEPRQHPTPRQHQTLALKGSTNRKSGWRACGTKD